MTIIHYETAESVLAGHPDKLCDYLADCVLDACLAVDPKARVACEVMATKGRVIVAGEIACKERINIRQVIRQGLLERGYQLRDYKIQVYIQPQSEEIAEAIVGGDELGAGDQGTVYGYAANESENLLPMAVYLANKLAQAIDQDRQINHNWPILPDGKVQVTVRYVDGFFDGIETLVVSVQHPSDVSQTLIKAYLHYMIIDPTLKDWGYSGQTQLLVNPSGRFVKGGPEADTGLTGRKLMVDTYGGLVPHGGGAFSGKDLTKVDRSGVYLARRIAKSIVKAGIAQKCLVGLSYAIGQAEPVMVSVNTYGTSEYTDDEIIDLIRTIYDLTPQGMMNLFSNKGVQFKETACYGHFHDDRFPWEQTDNLIEVVKADAN